MERTRSPAPLSQSEAEDLLHRAAEIDSRLPSPVEGLNEEELEKIAVESGISPAALRTAMVEARMGGAPRPEALDRVVGPRRFSVERTLPLPSSAVKARLADVLSSHQFEVKRDFGDRTVWHKSESFWAEVKRMFVREQADLLREEIEFEVSVLDLAPGQSRVRITVHLLGEWSAMFAGASAAVAAGAGLAIASPWLAGLAGTPSGAWILSGVGVVGGLGGWIAIRRSLHRDVQELRDYLEGRLDQIEHP